MNSIPVLCLLLVTTATVAGDSFDRRVALATDVARTEAGKTYNQKLWRVIGQPMADIVNECFPMLVELDTEAFAIVATVTASGEMSDVEVRPKTAMTQCFVERFSQLSCPAPPATAAQGMPQTFELTVVEPK